MPRHPLLLLAVALLTLGLLPAGASAGETIECVAPVGPGGQAMRVTMRVGAGHCPRPGEAIPAHLVVGTPVPAGGAAKTQRSSGPVLASLHGVAGSTAARPQVSAAAVAAMQRAVAAAAAVRGGAPVLPDTRTSAMAAVSTADELNAPQVTLPTIPGEGALKLLLIAVVGGAGLLAGPGGRVRWSA